jgi:hypothetical protein
MMTPTKQIREAQRPPHHMGTFNDGPSASSETPDSRPAGPADSPGRGVAAGAFPPQAGGTPCGRTPTGGPGSSPRTWSPATPTLPLGAVDTVAVAVAERLDVSKIATPGPAHFSVVQPRHTPSFTLLPE